MLATLLAFLCLWPGAVAAQEKQEKDAPVGVTHVLGFEAIKRNAKGKLSLQGGMLHFQAGMTQADLPVKSIQDVVTGVDSRRLIGGPVGTMTMLAPYGSGRFLSLFREKIDVLTLAYRDASGGLHGAIFTLPEGKAKAMKEQLVAMGVHSSTPEEPAKAEAGKEKKQ